MSSQAISGVLMRSCSKDMHIFRILLHISRAVFHKNTFVSLLLSLFHKFFFKCCGKYFILDIRVFRVLDYLNL